MKKPASGEAMAPMSPDVAAARQANDPLAELDALEAQMRELELPVAQRGQPGSAGASLDDAPAAGGDVADGEDEAPTAIETEAMEEAPAPAPVDADASPGPRRDRSAEKQARDRCADMCSLRESICELEVRICALSESHEGDPIYADACERAIEDCQVAGDACDMCDA